jgi:hypothetical protein
VIGDPHMTTAAIIPPSGGHIRTARQNHSICDAGRIDATLTLACPPLIS